MQCIRVWATFYVVRRSCLPGSKLHLSCNTSMRYEEAVGASPNLVKCVDFTRLCEFPEDNLTSPLFGLYSIFFYFETNPRYPTQDTREHFTALLGSLIHDFVFSFVAVSRRLLRLSPVPPFCLTGIRAVLRLSSGSRRSARRWLCPEPLSHGNTLVLQVLCLCSLKALLVAGRKININLIHISVVKYAFQCASKGEIDGCVDRQTDADRSIE